MAMPRKKRNKCLLCSKETQRPGYKYCTNACQIEYQYLAYIEKWKNGKETGLQTTGIVTKSVKRYLRNKFGDKCLLCGWSETNPITGKVPLVADHIDGNWRNNVENNLRLICPNCDSLSSTYSNLNKGKGRQNRALSNRTKEARLLKKESSR